jgi:hypothetical protein
MTTKASTLTFGLIATLAACSQSSPPGSVGDGASKPGASPAAPVAASRLTPTKSTYDVELKPETKTIDAGTMSRAFRGTGTDGTLKFDAASAPAVAALTPGAVVIFAGTALLKVSGVNSAGGTISVTGTPAGLEDAIQNGHISWTARFDFNKMVFNPPPGFHRVVDDSGPMLALKNFLGTAAQAAFSLSSNTWNGKVKDWDVTIALTPSSGNLHVDLHANKSIGGGTVDVHGVGQLNGLTNQTSITLANGSTTEITFNNNGLKGTVDFNWKIAFDAEHGGNEPKLKESDVENLPFSLDFPIPVGPIPFVVKFKTGFAFQPFISSKVAVAEGSYHASFGGDIPMTDSASADSAAAGTAPAATTPPPDPPAGAGGGTISGDGSIQSYGGTLSLAAIGLSTTVALPKISLSIGLPSALNEFLQSPDFGGPYATLMTQANFLATGTLTMVQCEKRELNILAATGYKPGLLGKLKLQPKSKTVFEKTFTEIRPPNITLCKN